MEQEINKETRERQETGENSSEKKEDVKSSPAGEISGSSGEISQAAREEGGTAARESSQSRETGQDSSGEKEERQPVASQDSEMQLFLDEMNEVNRGAIVKGRIVKISGEDVYVDIGHKCDGIVPLSEFDPDETPEVGQEIKVLVQKMEDRDGNLVVSKRMADAKVAWDEILEAYNQKKPIKARVTKKLKSGLDAVYKGVRCFVPASQISDKKEYNLDKYVGNSYEFAVIEASKNKKRNSTNVILSRKIILEEQEKARMEAVFKELYEGKRVKGTVKSITEYGAFVDIGGVDGLLHITDMSWGHISNPSDVVSVGQELEVQVLHFDKEKGKVSLGLKQLMPDPWASITELFPVGSIVEGKVKNLTDFGAFITLTDGVDGLVHVSDLSWTKKGIKPRDVLNVGDRVKVKVLAVDTVNRRISLGIKQLTTDPWSRVDEMFETNSIATGRVKNITQFGAFIELDEGIEGLVHISDMSWTKRINHPSEVVREGDIVEVKILSIDKEAKRISLGLKQVNPDPWLTVHERYQVGTVTKGKVVNLKKYGAFVELEEGIEGLVHVSDMSWTRKIEHPSQVVKVGDIIDVKVLELDQNARKIQLGIKQLTEDPWLSIAKRYPVNSVIEARVTHFTKFGAFLEVEEGIEGLLHTSDLSWTRKITDPSEVLAENQIVRVKVLSVDPENKRISLGLKQLTEDPFVEIREWYNKGKIIEGKVKSLTEFGAFVEIKENIEGLVHISQLSDERVEKVEDAVKVGDTVRVKIIDINETDRKLKLSIKAAIAAEAARTYTAGDEEEVGGVSVGDAFKKFQERSK